MGMMRYRVYRNANNYWGEPQWGVWDEQDGTMLGPLVTSYQAARRAARVASLNHAVREQWRKYDEALAAGKPYVAIVQINRKLVRLEHERDALEVSRG
jgi:hypothetical protein